MTSKAINGPNKMLTTARLRRERSVSLLARAVDTVHQSAMNIGELLTFTPADVHLGELVAGTKPLVIPAGEPMLQDEEFTEQRFMADPDELAQLIKLTGLLSQQHALGDLVEMAENLAEKRLMDFKRAVKPSVYTPAQYEMVQKLNAIEEKVDSYPLIAPKQATVCLGLLLSSNPSRDVGKLVKDRKLFGFTFGESKVLQLPYFQFNLDEQKTWKPVGRLCELLSELNDWAVYDWLTSYNEDLESTPADALAAPDKYDDLIDLAGLYRNESRFTHLSHLSRRSLDNG